MRKHFGWLIPVLITASIAWSIYDWSKYHVVLARLHDFVYTLVALGVSELCFIAGALIMAAEVAATIGSSEGWLHHARHPRRSLRASMTHMLHSRWFGLGFWLNFIGAVTTTLTLIGGVIWLLPVQSWGLLVLLIVDVIATFSWRIPVHVERRRQKRVATQ